MSELAKTLRLSAVPLYIQVAAELRRRIESGHWASGQKISTIEDLQEEFGVARVTVRQAVELLEKDGLVRRQQGKGTFVAADVEDTRWLKLDTSWSSLIETLKHNVPKFMPVSAPMPAGAPRMCTGTIAFVREVSFRAASAGSRVRDSSTSASTGSAPQARTAFGVAFQV